MSPLGSRAIRVHLDAEIVRILEIDGLAHEVIGHAGPHTELAEMTEKPAERRAIRKQYGVVVQPEQTVTRHRANARTHMQLHEWRVPLLRAQDHPIPGGLERAQSKDALVVVERAAEIGHL